MKKTQGLRGSSLPAGRQGLSTFATSSVKTSEVNEGFGGRGWGLLRQLFSGLPRNDNATKNTLQQFNASTLQRFNNSTIQRFNASTLQRFNENKEVNGRVYSIQCGIYL
ncbi:MAG: hypothetical protein E4G95_03455 [Bacteroidia bacterium]|nr:MAG: hypothetical protein E4G95_03455 [Bacteroidia bacterium]